MKFLCAAILIFSGFMETTSENFKVVGSAAPLVVQAGEELVLPCSLQPNISAVDMMVEWIRTDWTDTDNLVHLYQDLKDRNEEQIRSYRGRTALFKEELKKGNTSLKLSVVQTSDEGSYKCLVKSTSWYDDVTVHVVQVKVHSKVVGPTVPLVVEAGEDLVLPCSLQHNISAEDMMVEWIRPDWTETSNLVHLYENHRESNEDQMESYRGRTALYKEQLQKGNASLKLSVVQPSDEGAFKCLLRYRAWYDDITVYVEVKELDFHAWKIVIICLSVFAVMLMVFTAYILKDKSSENKLSPLQCSAVAYMRVKSQYVREELDLKRYNTSEEGYRKLIPAMTNCRKARFAACNLTAKSIKALSAALQKENSSLKELDLSYNILQDSEEELLSAGLRNSKCKLEILSFAACNLTVKSIKALSAALQKENSSLKELDLSNNDIQDSGVELLSAGLRNSHCKLEILRLSGCMVTEVGCSALASALSANPSHLKELDLTYNHPVESGVQLLSATLEDPYCSRYTLRVEHGGEKRIKPGLKKYYCEFTLDPNTAYRRLSLSDGNRKVKGVWEDQSYPDHPERFDEYVQVLSRESVTGRCYWEAEWSGDVYIALSCKSISRKGGSNDCVFGRNVKSWILICSDNSYTVRHNNIRTELSTRPSGCKRVGVYVDCPAGTLSFYRVSSDQHTLTHLHTFYTSFTETLQTETLHTEPLHTETIHTEPLHTGFFIYPGSSVCLI